MKKREMLDVNKEILINYLNSLEQCGIPGCDCAVIHNHELVFRHTAGYADSKREKSLTDKNTYWLYSASKLITCTAIMQLIEKGLFDLDTPVSNILPEYKNLNVKTNKGLIPAKNPMTIRHLLSMQSGLNYDLDAPSIRKVVEETNNEATTRQVIAALANEPLEFEPGTHFLYSLSHDVLGAVVEVVSGQKFSEYLHEHIFKPLGMKNTGFELTHELEANMSDLFEFDMDNMLSTPSPNKNRYFLTKTMKVEEQGSFQQLMIIYCSWMQCVMVVLVLMAINFFLWSQLII